MVRKLRSNQGVELFTDVPEAELRTQLHQLGAAEERIFSGDKGSLDWHFTIPGAPATAA